jgi:hypothetical protein
MNEAEEVQKKFVDANAIYRGDTSPTTPPIGFPILLRHFSSVIDG